MSLVCNVASLLDSLDNVLTFLRRVVLFASCSGDGMTFLDRFTGCDDDVIAFLGSVAVFAGWLEDVLNALNALSCDTVRFVDETAVSQECSPAVLVTSSRFCVESLHSTPDLMT